MRKLRIALLLSASLLGSGTAFAAANAAREQNYSGTVKHFILTPVGSINGMVLDNGTEILFPPFVSTQIAYAVKLGDTVNVKGVSMASGHVVRAMSVADAASGQTVAIPEVGRWGKHHRRPMVEKLSAEGVVGQVLYGRRGNATGLLLTDGTVLRAPPRDFASTPLEDLAKPGAKVTASGFGTANAMGRIVMVREIGADAAHMTKIALPDWHHRHHSGPGLARPPAQ